MALLGSSRAWRSAHATAGLVGALFLASSAITGLLWANASRLYWRADDYKKKKAPVAGPALESARIDIRRVLARAQSELGTEANMTALTLKSEAGRLVYEAQTGKRSVLIDAITGRSLSPLSADDASRFADQYAPKGASRLAARHEVSFMGRDGRKRGPVWRVTYRDNGGTEIVLDDMSGQIIEEFDPSRRFHFWIMRLHKLDFFHTDRLLTAIPGLCLIGLVISGLRLWLQARRGKTGVRAILEGHEEKQHEQERKAAGRRNS